jgi:hypothetical protein
VASGLSADRQRPERFQRSYANLVVRSTARETHFNPCDTNQDGAVVIYSVDAGTGHLKPTLFFFKFQNEHIPDERPATAAAAGA